jgi:hypothetical protein
VLKNGFRMYVAYGCEFMVWKKKKRQIIPVALIAHHAPTATSRYGSS